jgi:hypothetical protein
MLCDFVVGQVISMLLSLCSNGSHLSALFVRRLSTSLPLQRSSRSACSPRSALHRSPAPALSLRTFHALSLRSHDYRARRNKVAFCDIPFTSCTGYAVRLPDILCPQNRQSHQSQIHVSLITAFHDNAYISCHYHKDRVHCARPSAPLPVSLRLARRHPLLTNLPPSAQSSAL